MKKLLVFSALLVSFTAFCDTNPTLVIKNKKHPKREITFNLPAFATIKTTTGKWYNVLITGVHDSILTMKARSIFPQGATKAENRALRKINKDKTLTADQRQAAFNKIWYPDSLQLPLNSIQRMNYALSNTKNGKTKATIAWSTVVLSSLIEISLLNLNQPGNQGEEQASYPLHINNNIAGAIMMVVAWVPLVEYYYTFRPINPANWQVAK